MTPPFCALPLLVLLQAVALGVAFAQGEAVPAGETKSDEATRKAIPFDQLGAEAQKQYEGDGISITPMSTGVHLRAVMQDLEGDATAEGLWLTSTADEDIGKPNRFSVRPVEIGRGQSSVMGHQSTGLPSSGVVQATKELVSFNRPGLVEEYSVSTDGVRQDVILLERPTGGTGALNVILEVAGARAEAASYGAKLTVVATGRELAYSRLKVTDASGREVTAQMKVEQTDRICIEVEDASATYPLRIDPTFSDADWISMGGCPGANKDVLALAVDGSGNLYVGGSFDLVGNVLAHHVAKWNGSSWSALGSGTDADVHALVMMGSDLYVGGIFTLAGGTSANYIAKWDGAAWSALGTGVNSGVGALAVSGSNLYVGGDFTLAGGVSANYIAKWDGIIWSALGSGLDEAVHALAVMGSDLYAGGSFHTAGGNTAKKIAKWNGSSWSALGTGVDGDVNALAVMGSDLYVAGTFSTAGSVNAERIAKWNGTSWSALGSGLGTVFQFNALSVSGSDLYAGGFFYAADESTLLNIAKWNGTSWSPVGSGTNDEVYSMVASGSDLYVGGRFNSAGGVGVDRIAKWSGTSWSAMGSGTNGRMRAFAFLGGNLYAGGSFTTVGGVNANGIAKWNGSNWAPLGAGVDGEVRSLVAVGSDLYVGGGFTTAGGVPANDVAKWNGSAWSALGSGMDDLVEALAVMGGNLYAGGRFQEAGGVFANRVAKWNGSGWSKLGTGTDGDVRALAVIGSNLYAAGDFSTAGGVSAKLVAKWNGSAWSALGSGLSGPGDTVGALAVIGTDLYAGGFIDTAGGVSANGVAKWNGSSWSPLGSGVDGQVFSMAVSGTELYVGGLFSTAGGVSANQIAKWDGASWSALGSGLEFSTVDALGVNGSDLFAGGQFVVAGGQTSAFIARAHIEAAVPDIAVEQPAGTDLTDGAATVNYNNVNVGSPSVLAFTVKNTGTVNLTGLAITKNGANSAEFAVGSLGSTTLAPSASTTFNVTFTPTLGGTRTAAIHIASNDADENPFDINLTGTGVGTPEIAVEQPAGTNLTDGVSAVNLGNAVAAAQTVSKVFTIKNSGTGDLTGLGSTIDGTNAGDFAVTVNPTAPVAPSGSTTFTVAFTPSATGARSAALHIASNDANENPFDITLNGTGVTDTVAPPAPTISAPLANAVLPLNTGGAINVTGTATDGLGVKQVQVALNSGAFTDATLGTPGAPSTTFTLSIVPASGANTVQVKTIDYGNNSATSTRTFSVTRLLVVNVDPQLGSVTAGFAGSTNREIGKSYTITATPKPPTIAPAFQGAIFTGWTVSGATNAQIGIAESTKEKQTFTFIYREGLTLTAGFVLSPFASMVGTYNGLIRPSDTLPDRPNAEPDGTVRTNSSEGRFTATVQNTGAFSGTLTIDGFALTVSGAFDSNGDARFGTARLFTQTVARTNKPSLLVTLHLDINTPGDHDQITGTVTATDFKKSVTTAVSTVNSDRAYYNGTSQVVPSVYLGAAGATSTFTVILPPKDVIDQTAGLQAQDYPRGTGTATITLTKAGVVMVTGILADNTAISASSALSQDNTFPLFAALYNKLGFLSGMVALDNNQADSDLAAANLQWLRPFQGTSHYYPYGWPEVIKVDLLGARYLVTSGQSVLKTVGGGVLPGPDTDGNATLTLSEGQLSSTLQKQANFTTADLVTKVPGNDPTFTLSINRSLGTFTGTFTHTNDTTPTCNGIFYQKGTSAGGYGFFMTKQPTPIDYTGESGGVWIIGHP